MANLEELILQAQQELGTTSAEKGVVPSPATGGTVSAPSPAPAGTTPPGQLTGLDAQIAQAQQELDTGDKQERGAFRNAVAAGNSVIANIIGLPADVVADVMKRAGVNVVKDTESGTPAEWGDAQRRVQQAFRSVGIDVDADMERLSGRIGAEGAKGLATLMAIMAVGPGVSTGLTEAGWAKTGEALGTIVNALRTYPVASVLGELGGAAGGVVGGEKGGPLGAFGGALVGGGLTQLGAALAGKVLSPVVSGAKAIGRGASSALETVSDYLAGARKPGPPSSDVIDGVRTINERLDIIGDDVVEAAAKVRQLKADKAPMDEQLAARRELFDLRREETEAQRVLREFEDRLPKGYKAEDFKGPVAPAGNDPLRTQVFAEEQLHDIYQQIENKVIKAVDEIPAPKDGRTSEAYAQLVNERINQAEEAARKIETTLWNRTPLKETVPMHGAKDDLRVLQAELNQDYNKGFIPQDLIDEAMSMTKAVVVRGPGGRMQRVDSPPTVQQVRSFVSKVETMARKEKAEPAPNWTLVANMHKVSAVMNKAIADALPDDVSIQQARAASVKINDIFTRSNLRDILATGPQGAEKVAPARTMDHLTRKWGGAGLEDILTMTREIGGWKRIPGQKNAYPTALSPAEVAQVKETQKFAEDSIRARFREIATEITNDNPDPARRAQLLEKSAREFEKDVKPFAKLSSEFDRVASDINALRAERDVAEKSALARYAPRDANTAIQRVWSSSNPAKEARELMKTFRQDPDALSGFRNGMMDELLARTRNDPTRIQEAMANPKIDRLLRTTLPSDQYARLERITDVAVRLERGEWQTFAQQHASTFSTIASVFGAGLGRHIPRLIGMGGTVQTPGIFARIMREKTASFIFKDDPKRLFKEAVRDEAWEKLLLKKDPTSAKEFAESITIARRAATQMEGARQAAGQYWDEQADTPQRQYFTRQQMQAAEKEFSKLSPAEQKAYRKLEADKPYEEAIPYVGKPRKGVVTAEELVNMTKGRDSNLFSTLNKAGNLEGLDAMLSREMPNRVEDRRYMTSPNNPFMSAADFYTPREGYQTQAQVFRKRGFKGEAR